MTPSADVDRLARQRQQRQQRQQEQQEQQEREAAGCSKVVLQEGGAAAVSAEADNGVAAAEPSK